MIAAVAFRLSALPSSRLTEDPSLHLAAFICWTQAELYWSIVSATIPSMRPFLRGLSTTETTIFEDSYGQASRTDNQVSKVRSRSKSSRVSRFTTTKTSGKRSQRSQSQSAIEMDPLPERREVHAPSRTGSRLRHNLPSTFRTDRVQSVRAATKASI